MKPCLGYAVLLAMVAFCCSENKKNEVPPYQHLVSFSPYDFYDVDFIPAGDDMKRIKKIKVYRYSATHNYLGEDSIQVEGRSLYSFGFCKYDKNGRLIQFNKAIQDYSDFRKNIYFYDEDLLIAMAMTQPNYYDTVYTLYQHNDSDDLVSRVEFSNRRNEVSSLQLQNNVYQPGSVIIVRKEYVYDSLLTYIWNYHLTWIGDELIIKSSRPLAQEPSYKEFHAESHYFIRNGKYFLKHEKQEGDEEKNIEYDFYDNGNAQNIKDNLTLKSFDDKGNITAHEYQKTTMEYSYDFNLKGDWIKRIKRNSDKILEIIVREIEYYQSLDEEEQKTDFSIGVDIWKKAENAIHVIPTYSENKLKAIAEKNADIESGAYEKEITLEESPKLEDFTPKYWQLLSYDTGTIKHLGKVLVAAYHTPVPTGDDDLYRCLVFYEITDHGLRLKKQLFKTLESGAADGLQGAISIEVDDGITISYQYMRSEASYEFEYRPDRQDWLLVHHSRSGRTCCEYEYVGYNYKEKKIYITAGSTGDEEETESVDTAVYVLKRDSLVSIENLKQKTLSTDSIRIKGSLFYF